MNPKFKLANSKQVLLQNTFMLYLLTFSNYFLSLVVVPYETRILGPTVYGTLGAATAIMVYFQLVIDFGFLLSGTQEVARSRDDRAEVSRIFTATTLAKLLLIVISLAALVVLCQVIPAWRERQGLYLLFFCGTAINSLIPDYLYRGLEKMSAITVRTVCIKAFFTLGIVAFMKTPEDVWMVPAVNAIGCLAALGLTLVHLSRKLDIHFTAPNWSEVIRSLKRSSTFFYSRIATTAYSALNTVILDMISASGATVGYYSSADRLITTGRSALSPISDSLYPYMVKNRDFKLVRKILLIFEPLIFLFCAAVFIWADPMCFAFWAGFCSRRQRSAGNASCRGHYTPQLYFRLSHPHRHGTYRARQLLRHFRFRAPHGESGNSIFHRSYEYDHTGLRRLRCRGPDPGLSHLCSLAASQHISKGGNAMSKMDSYLCAIFRRIFRLFPINQRKVVFCSYYGKGYSDNPKAIAESLLASGQHLKLVWLLQDRRDATSLPPGIRPASYWGIHRAWELSTAAVWVDNCRRGERGKRKGQHYLQTWHGFALKRIEADAEQALDGPYVRGCMQDSAQCDLMVSGSGFMTQLYQRAFWYDGPVAEYGSPRNDVLFSSQPHLLQKVRQAFSLPENQKLVLYAPTFRSDHSSRAYNLDVPSLLDACHTRFGGSWSCLVRLHPNVAKHSTGLFAYNGSTILDATAYPDMQELLYAVDMLISDYSSCMFDFALSGKPCLQFATDIESYRQDRNFYFPLDRLPFPLSSSNPALCQAVRSFDAQEYARNWAAFAQENHFCEDGHASARCADWILARLGRKEKTP